MHFKSQAGLATAVAVLTAITFNFGAPSVEAHTRFGGPPPPPALPPPMVVDNVRAFGALGDGVTDDTTAIQNAALDAAHRGGSVFFPPGTYLHANAVEFSTPVSGAGASSVLKSNNPANCAVILTGVGPSIQNLVISTQGLAGASSIASPNTASLLVQNASSFTVSGLTIATGTNMWGALVLSSSTGAINSVCFDGTGNANDFGVAIDQCSHVTVSNSLFQNDAIGVDVLPNGAASQSIAVMTNTIGTVSWPITEFGVEAQSVNNLYIAQNTMQMLNSSGTFPVIIASCDNSNVTGNNIWGGILGCYIISSGPAGNFVTQNAIHNCGEGAIGLFNAPNTAIQVTNNLFGECGLLTPFPVILIGGVASDASGATTFVQNNAYQGHLNNLTFLVRCIYTTPHIPASHVTGNTQTQTALSNSI